MSRVLDRELHKDEFVDHINGDKLDNRRENLRLVSKAQNGWNRKPPRDNKSGYTGVHFDVCRSRWMAYINVNGQRFYVPACATAEESAWMRDQYALELHGVYARTNFDYTEVPRQDRAEVAS
ncbi:HNH endonuclease [Streptomyces sp. SID6673]|nr:HNH endonuclease [Streptomyces sp. SID11726]NDZ94915.1 HNH endonuclease [Streptomyces sp. SID11726]NEB23075.1 HNH endonuclease [Streptomyces sp. SID6673]